MKRIYPKLKQHPVNGFALLAALLIAGCENSVDPGESPADSYVASTLVTTGDGVLTDHIANGSSINLTLTPQGTTSGSMHIEAWGSEPDFDADLTGTWTISGLIVDLNHTADTFLRDIPLVFDGAALAGDRIIGDTRVQVTLTPLPRFD